MSEADTFANVNDARSPGGNLPVLLRLAGPIALSQLSFTAMGFVDTIMVGRLGEVALAGVALGNAIYFAILIFGLGVIMGVGPLIAQAFGARADEDVARFARQGLWLATLLTPLGLVATYFSGELLGYLGQSEEVVTVALGYQRVLMWSMWPFLAFGVLRSLLESLNRPLVVTALSLAAVGVNALLNYIFIYGNFGCPALGTVGSGIATSITYALLFVGLALYVMVFSDLRRYRVLQELSVPRLDYLLRLLRVGSPIGVSFGLEVGYFSTTAILVGTLGSTALAAHEMVIQLCSISFMVPLAVGMAASIRVGNLVGAREELLARQAGYIAIALGGGAMLVSAVFFMLSPKPLLALFVGSERVAAGEELVSVAVQLLFYAGAFQIMDGIQTATSGSLRGLKDTFWPMVIGLISYWVVGLGAGYYLMGEHGAAGLWMGIVCGISVAAVLLVTRWRRLSGQLKARRSMTTVKPPQLSTAHD